MILRQRKWNYCDEQISSTFVFPEILASLRYFTLFGDFQFIHRLDDSNGLSTLLITRNTY